MAWKFDREAMQRAREEQERQTAGGEFYTFEEGETVVYICEAPRPDDVLNFVEVVQHGGLTRDEPSMVCLNPDKNKVLSHPEVQRYLEELGKDIEGGCPRCEHISAGHYKGDELKNVKAKSRYLWSIIPIKFRQSGRLPWQDLQPADNVVPCFTPYTLWDGIMDVFTNEGDITAYDGATYIRVTREGQKLQTEYSVVADSESLKRPVKLSKTTIAAIREALAPGGSCDLYKIIANLTLSYEDALKRVEGDVDIEDEEEEKGAKSRARGRGQEKDRPARRPDKSPPPDDDDGDEADGEEEEAEEKKKPAAKEPPKKTAAPAKAPPAKTPPAKSGPKPPPCFKLDCTPDDEQCQKCAPFKEECATACGVDVPPDFVAKGGKKAAAPKSDDAETPVAAGACQEGREYRLPDGTTATFKGTSKGKAFFERADGSREKLAVDEEVIELPSTADDASEESAADEGGDADETNAAPDADEDPAIAEMEKMLAAKKAKKGKGK
jgi:hypothetical protein